MNQTDMTHESLTALANSINGRARNRTLTKNDIQTFMDLVNEHRDNTATHTIRVYSAHGFVANAYKYRADIACLTATRNADGLLEIRGGWVDGHRSHGQGALITINNRAA